MFSTHLADALFLGGAVLAAVLLLYGAWLCLGAGEDLPGAASSTSSTHIVDSAHEDAAAARAGFTCVCFLAPALLMAIAGTAVTLSDEPGAATFRMERGLAAYEKSRYADAIAEFRRAAAAGNSRAEEILGFMFLHGPDLYGADVPADRDEAVRWFARAAKDGREVSQYMHCVLTGHPADTALERSGCGQSPTQSARLQEARQ